MPATISYRIRAYLGWCPNAHAMKVQTAGHRNRTESPGIDGPPSPQSGIFPATTPASRWMTGVSVVIVIATCFVGGNLWWPAIVLAILGIFLIIHIRTLKNQGGA